MDIGENILQLSETVEFDDSILSYEYDEYNPIIGTHFNSAGVINITIENFDQFIHPHKSGLLIQGKLVKKADKSAYGDNDLIALVNNALPHLFSNIRYSLGGKEIESINNPGQASTMFNILTRSSDFAQGIGMAECWTPDSSVGTAAAANMGFARRQAYIIKQSDPKERLVLSYL
ncbi:MAG: hypothetical protein ABGX53_06905 [Candidatus Thioglobus sp.]